MLLGDDVDAGVDVELDDVVLDEDVLDDVVLDEEDELLDVVDPVLLFFASRESVR